MGSGYQPLTDDRSIRILTLHPNPDFAAPLECGLCEVSLDPALAPPFHALSYVWGTPAGEEPILCNGDVLPVTKNCAEALRYLRQAKEPVDLWVDALCINQQSVEERGQQVPLMGDIYMAAQKVYIFLGPGSAETRILFRDMHVLFWIFRITRAVKLSLRWQESLISFLGYTGYSAALARIGLGEWFERIWTLQEFVFARDPVLVSGSSQVSIRALCERPDDYYGVFEVDRYPLRLGLTRLWDRITFRDVY
ncbi:HET-domain-containing protein, partial [Thozetella sp. PMI_491]